MTTALPPPAEPAQLTDALREAGVLDRGAVAEVTVLADRQVLVSRIIRLGLHYDRPAPDAPASLILKVPLPAFAKSILQSGRHEIGFYSGLATLMPPRLVPRYFGGAVDEDVPVWHLLLEDLTDSHRLATEWPLPPSLPQAEAIVRALARLHAAWWDDSRLGVSVGSFASREDTAEHGDVFAGHYRRFADQLGDRLSPQRRAIYDRFIVSMPRLLERYHERRNVSIAHGDAHVWNFLLPKDEGRDAVRVFDFDQWRINVPAQDLAYMIAMQLYPERRSVAERLLLDCYYQSLLEYGVTGYDRAALDRDYRLAVLWHISKPVWQWTVRIPPLIWWNNLERIFLAVDDLGGVELLD
jgi:aminoglycoside phosphotransferase (APT) family kinase protein